MNKNNKSGYTGVYFDNNSQKWRAQVSVNGEKIKLGYFKSVEDAALARKEAKDFYSFNNFDGFKIPHYIEKCKKVDGFNYDEAVKLLFKAAHNYINGKYIVAFSTYAVSYIMNSTHVDAVIDTNVSPMLKDWLDGTSINKLLKKYNLKRHTVDTMLKKEIQNCLNKCD